MADSVRCFVGLPLPQSWQEALDRVALGLGARLASRISWTKPGNWHITLKFLGQVEQARMAQVAAALRGVVFAPFALTLGGAGSFEAPGRAPKALWTGVATGGQACAQLAAQVDAALAACGLAQEARAFRPHVTIGRVKDAAPGDDWSGLARTLERELGREVFAPARMERFVLWRSVLGPGGPKYAALEVVPARDHGGCPDGGTA